MTRSWEVKATTEGLVASHPRLPLTQESQPPLPALSAEYWLPTACGTEHKALAQS